LNDTNIFNYVIPGVPIQNVAIPCDDGIQKTTLGNDVLLKLLELLKTQRQNLSGKLGVYFEIA